jgi:hypothetical protein
MRLTWGRSSLFIHDVVSSHPARRQVTHARHYFWVGPTLADDPPVGPTSSWTIHLSHFISSQRSSRSRCRNNIVIVSPDTGIKVDFILLLVSSVRHP